MTYKMATLGTAAMLRGVAEAATSKEAGETWRADLAPLNANVVGSDTRGTATITIAGDTLTISVEAAGAVPGITYLQHFQGFAEGDAAAVCPTASADANGVGVNDLVETEPVADTTMVAFDADPVGMDMLGGDFPTADASGSYSYEQSTALATLADAFANKFPGQQFNLDRRLVFLHGVPDSVALPDSAQSVGGVPTRVKLPITCGELHRVEG